MYLCTKVNQVVVKNLMLKSTEIHQTAIVEIM